jgi:hypothetical protein
MAGDLAAADPANAARYQSNLKAFDERLDALDLRIKQRVAGIAGKPYFVFHEAFDYFEANLWPQAHRRVQRGSRSAAGRAACRRDAQAPAGSGQDLCSANRRCARAWPRP